MAWTRRRCPSGRTNDEIRRRQQAARQGRAIANQGRVASVPHIDAELVIRVVAMPEATNPSGDIFGGWLLSQMDLAAWISARRRTPHRLATVALDNVVLHKPVFVGDCLLCYARVERVGRTSITIDVEALVERLDGGAVEQVTEGRFTIVALGPDRRPVPIEPGSPGD
jgi:acyl-CoA thioesterase YciA